MTGGGAAVVTGGRAAGMTGGGKDFKDYD